MSDIAKEYGRALFDLAEEEKITDEVFPQANCILTALTEEPEYVKFLATPGISLTEKEAAVQAAFQGCHPYVMNTLRLMLSRGYAQSLAGTLEEFIRLRREARGEAEATVETARALSEEEKKALTATLSQKYGKTIILKEIVDESLLGGARVYLEGRLLDGTLRHRLDGIGARLRETVL